MNFAALERSDQTRACGRAPRRAKQKGALLRLLTCGSVDDGKSTLIGRLLWDAAGVTEDQRAAITLASHNRAVNGEKIDFSLLLDGLQAEREQGITIDIAWRYFETPDRRFIIIDSPGHEQYTRNMATGASPRRYRHPAGRRPPRRQAPDPPPRRDLRSGRHQEGGPRRQQDGRWSTGRRRASARSRRISAPWPELRFRARSTTIPVAALTGDNVVAPLGAHALVCRADAARLSGERGSRGRQVRRCAVPHAGAARAARLGRFPRLCRHGHLGPHRRRRADRRCAKRARRHAAAHRDHGRRSRLGRQGRCGHARARHRSRHLARRGALGGAPPADQCRRDRGAARLAVGDAVRSGSGLSAAHGDRSHARSPA